MTSTLLKKNLREEPPRFKCFPRPWEKPDWLRVGLIYMVQKAYCDYVQSRQVQKSVFAR